MRSIDRCMDHLNAALSDAEDRLRLAAVRVVGEVELEPGMWCLTVRDDERESRSLLTKATREHRILAAHQLDALFASMVANESGLEREIAEAIAAAEAFHPTGRP